MHECIFGLFGSQTAYGAGNGEEAKALSEQSHAAGAARDAANAKAAAAIWAQASRFLQPLNYPVLSACVIISASLFSSEHNG